MTAIRGTLHQHRFVGWWPGLPGWVRNAIEWAAVALVGLVVAGLVFVALAPRLLGWHFVVVAGGSMDPTIHFGSVAVMRDVDRAAVQVGEIAMYKDPRSGKVVTHRIIGVSEDGQSLTTKGDANNTTDEGSLPRSAVRGEYLFSVPEAGRFVHWMGTRQGYLSIIIVPGAAIVLLELASIGRELRKRPALAGSEPIAEEASLPGD